MALNPMAPKLPKAAAFSLLSDLNEFFSLPLAERQAAFDDYGAAAEQREAALAAIQEDQDNARLDRAAASETNAKANEEARVTVVDAEVKARGIIADANDAAEAIKQIATDRIELADVEVKAAERKAADLTAGLAEAVEAAEARELAAGESALKLDQARVAADNEKDAYTALIADLQAVQRRVPGR